MTSDAFLEACGRVLSDPRAVELASVCASPIEPTDGVHEAAAAALGPTARAWAERVDHVEDAIVRARCARTGRDPEPYLRRPQGIRVDVLEAVARAFDAPDPGVRERALDALRWRLADELAATQPAGFAALFARAVQLRLAARRVAWNVDAGWAALEAALRHLEPPVLGPESGGVTRA
ncbi:MAG: hypothetical protein P1P87_01790 [Trueperaceae bacterium]|nr:hypothetical protein [Trueperaceae bacterium]